MHESQWEFILAPSWKVHLFYKQTVGFKGIYQLIQNLFALVHKLDRKYCQIHLELLCSFVRKQNQVQFWKFHPVCFYVRDSLGFGLKPWGWPGRWWLQTAKRRPRTRNGSGKSQLMLQCSNLDANVTQSHKIMPKWQLFFTALFFSRYRKILPY